MSSKKDTSSKKIPNTDGGNPVEPNVLYYGDNLAVLKKYIPDRSVDLIYLDPPFNSKSSYNVWFKEPTGEPSNAQIEVFNDSWHWTAETEKTFDLIIKNASSTVVDIMDALRNSVHKNDLMAYLTMMCIRLIELHRVLKDTGSIYLHCDPTASHYLKIIMDAIFGPKNFQNEIVWGYRTGGLSKKRWAQKHDIIFFYTKTNKYTFNPIRERIYYDKPFFNPNIDDQGRYYADVYLRDVWDDEEVKPVINVSKERIGYPTQKPESLLLRIIRASSNEGDIVLDPFCGCGTAIVAAQRLNRRWIGIDITHLAISVMKWRLTSCFSKVDIKVVGEPKDVSGAKELANEDRYQFQWWALSLINARPYGDQKKGADSGIDGVYYFTDHGKVNKVVVQVKSGHVSVNQIRELIAVMDRESAVMSFFITLEEPTHAMIEESVKKGFYTDSFENQYQKVQIFTISDLLGGKKPDTPQPISLH